MIDSVNYLASQAFGGAGADIIVDDLGFFDQPFFEDGPIAQAVENVASTGTIYVSAAGNSGQKHYEGNYAVGTDFFHNYGGGDITMSVTVAGGGTMRIFMQWNDPFGASGIDYNLYACTPGSTPLAVLTGGVCFFSAVVQDGNDDPFEALFVTNVATIPGNLDIFIDGFYASAFRRLEMHVIGLITVNQHSVPEGSIFGHAAVPGAIAVGAIDAFDPGNDDIESFSSRGPVDIFFPSFESRAKPDVAAIDGVSVTGAGGFPSTFFGTSAAAPHVAGVAALVLEAVRQATPGISKGDAATSVRSTILNTAVDLGVFGPDSIFGAGRVDALAAVDEALPVTDLSIIKSDSPDPVAAGSNLSYTLTVANAGPLDATGVTVTDTLPAGVTFVSSSPGSPTCNESSGTLTCALGTLASGTTIAVTIQVGVDPSTRGTLTNTANVAGNETDTDPSNDTSTATTSVIGEADLSVTKSDSPDQVVAGTDLSYVLTVANAGPSDATSVTITDTLPAGVTFVSSSPASPTCNESSGTMTCALGTLASGATTTIEVQVGVDPSTRGTLSNTASVASNETDPNPSNDTSSATTSVTAEADLSVTKGDSPDPVVAGTELSYTLTVSNVGTSSATGVSLIDALSSAMSFSSASPRCTYSAGTHQVTCSIVEVGPGETTTVTLQVIVDSSATGTISNTATAASAETDLSPADNAATATTTVTAEADLWVAKADSADPVIAATNLAYTLTVTNSGPSDATGVVMTDTLPSAVSYDSASAGCALDSGSNTVTCSLGNLVSGASNAVSIGVIVAASSTGFFISNTASVTGNEPDPNGANNTASQDTVVFPFAGFPSLSWWGLIAMSVTTSLLVMWRPRLAVKRGRRA